MNCTEAEERILEALDSTPDAVRRDALEAHLAVCPGCRNFRETQLALDRALAECLAPPVPGPGFDARLMLAVKAGQASELWDLAPDLLHLAGGAAVTLAAAWTLPFDRAMVLAAGGAATASSYALLAWVRTWLSELDERAG